MALSRSEKGNFPGMMQRETAPAADEYRYKGARRSREASGAGQTGDGYLAEVSYANPETAGPSS